jgi:hypothetical protein
LFFFLFFLVLFEIEALFESKVLNMSIALDSKPTGMPRGGFVLEDMKECSSPCSSLSASASSSIGRNSDVSSEGEDCEENEAQSSYKGPLDMMDALEEVLPIRFYFLFLSVFGFEN